MLRVLVLLSSLARPAGSCFCQTGTMYEGPTPFRGPVSVAVDGWSILVQRGLPQAFDTYCSQARLVETFDMNLSDGDFCFAAAGPVDNWPSVVTAQHFEPAQGGFDPGVAFIADTRLFFLGAGTRLLAYDLQRPARIWEDVAEMGFWHWSVYPDAVLMAGELELAAWDRLGTKLWTRFVEPPWSHRVIDHRVHLEVMGVKTDFPITGPPT